MDTFAERLRALSWQLWGDAARSRLDEPGPLSIGRRVGTVAGGHWDTRQEPTATFRTLLSSAQADFATFEAELTQLLEQDLAALERDLEAAGAPWTPGRGLP